MKSLLECFTKWFNWTHSRSGTLWEDRLKNEIVESGVAARTMAAHIDLNPVRAGMVKDPAEYRWSGYGETACGGKKEKGRKSRQGLVRAYLGEEGVGFHVDRWAEVSRLYRRLMGLALERKSGKAEVKGDHVGRKTPAKPQMNTAEAMVTREHGTALPDLKLAAMLRCRVRYFTDGAVIGSKTFVNEAFAAARERFTERRKDGARRMKGNGKAVAGALWSMSDLRVRMFGDGYSSDRSVPSNSHWVERSVDDVFRHGLRCI